MSRTHFGTDGIRGTVGEAPITPDFMLRLGHAVGQVLRQGERRPTVLIGKDTRISGYMLESALESGFNSAGVDVVLLGPLPTPGVAYLTRAQRASLGVVISASHNPFPDNGIKFFSAQGTKLDDGWEEAVEAAERGQPARRRAGRERRAEAAHPAAQRVGARRSRPLPPRGGVGRERFQVGPVGGQRVARGAPLGRHHLQERLDVAVHPGGYRGWNWSLGITRCTGCGVGCGGNAPISRSAMTASTVRTRGTIR